MTVISKIISFYYARQSIFVPTKKGLMIRFDNCQIVHPLSIMFCWKKQLNKHKKGVFTAYLRANRQKGILKGIFIAVTENVLSCLETIVAPSRNTP